MAAFEFPPGHPRRSQAVTPFRNPPAPQLPAAALPSLRRQQQQQQQQQQRRWQLRQQQQQQQRQQQQGYQQQDRPQERQQLPRQQLTCRQPAVPPGVAAPDLPNPAQSMSCADSIAAAVSLVGWAGHGGRAPEAGCDGGKVETVSDAAGRLGRMAERPQPLLHPMAPGQALRHASAAAATAAAGAAAGAGAAAWPTAWPQATLRLQNASRPEARQGLHALASAGQHGRHATLVSQPLTAGGGRTPSVDRRLPQLRNTHVPTAPGPLQDAAPGAIAAPTSAVAAPPQRPGGSVLPSSALGE